MDDYDFIGRKLREGMWEGNMHTCLRDTGRLAGGYEAAGRITPADVSALGDEAAHLAKNEKEARRAWREGVEYGRRSPVYDERPPAGDGHAFDWDQEFTDDDYRIVRREWLDAETVEEPGDFNPCQQLAAYISHLFEPDDYVGYVTETFDRDGKPIPTKGVYSWTAGHILELLGKGRFDDAVGTVNENAGAWIRFNPLDGKGVSDSNVTAFRYALVECDSMSVGEQVAIYRKLEIPCAFVVHSGGKSAHAIVKVFADDLAEYRRRVDFLYEVCKRNGLEVDRQNRNPSRLSRMPGAIRNGRPQYIIDTDIGKPSWDAWEAWIEDLNDDLPDIEDATRAVGNPPPLAPELIEGILRQGHKMRITGPSKAGKSFLLLELAVAIAEGGRWLGRKCAQGAVLYVNLELDPASCMHRIHDLYAAMEMEPDHADMLKVWNLRGRTVPLDKLAPKIIRRCSGMGLLAIIIDPIYKVLTGDENAASEMARFCNLFDRIARDCGCAIIDCHHHSKGDQGGKKSMDRASGSGVFARDPDALLDMIELDAGRAAKTALNEAECAAMSRYMDRNAEYDEALEDWRGTIGWDFAIVADKFVPAVESRFPAYVDGLRKARVAAIGGFAHATAWRIEPTLREFPPFEAVNIWFRFPLHVVDNCSLRDAEPADAGETWRRKQAADKAKARPTMETSVRNLVDEAFQDGATESVGVGDILEKLHAEYDGRGSRKTVYEAVDRRRYEVVKGVIYRLGKGDSEDA